MNNKVELLAPAGSREALVAAVENGADAVYLGGKLFNARQYAGNFDMPQLEEALDYAHIRGVNVYLAMNTLISDSEMRTAVSFAEKAYSIGVDGVIVQDLGFALILRDLFPDLGLHASTQMTIYNLEGVKMLEQLGFKRAVLARELSLDEIKFVAGNSNMEIEVFVHGALCICYSGQCLMSSIIGGRSGNRGKCAQPCRLPYMLANSIPDGTGSRNTHEKGRYLLSPRDLCTVRDLKRIIEAGVKSLKIEGRMKSAEYVATVVRIYRKYVDEALVLIKERRDKGIHVEDEDMKELAQVFNRGGFTEGYLFGKPGADLMCYEKPKNWGLYLGDVIAYDRSHSLLEVRLKEDLSTGDGVEVWNGEEESPGAVVTEIRCGGKNVAKGTRGDIVSIGAIRGRISKGDMVYKTSDKSLNEAAGETFSGRNIKKVKLTGNITIKSGQPVLFNVRDDLGNEAAVDAGYTPEAAISVPLTEKKVMEQLRKTGSTPFSFDAVNIELDKNLSIPAGKLNEIRRKALDEMSIIRVKQRKKEVTGSIAEKKTKILNFPGNSHKKIHITGSSAEYLKTAVYFYNWDENIDFSRLNADRIYLPLVPFLKYRNNIDSLLYYKKGVEIYVWLPAITRGNYDTVIKSGLVELADTGITGILIGNLGTLEYLYEYNGMKIIGDYSLNVFNCYSAKRLLDLGIRGITMSLEMTLRQIEGFSYFEGMDKEAVVYGRVPLMTSEYCPTGSIAGEFNGCSKCSVACRKGSYSLKDRKGMEFPVLCDRVDCRSTILNSNIMFIPGSVDTLKAAGIGCIRLYISDEKPSEIYRLADMHRNLARNGSGAITGYGDIVQWAGRKGFTKGHYFRGV